MNELIKQLNELSNLESDQFKSRSYKKAAITLSSLSESEFAERKSFLDLTGIGKSINSKILDYKSKGIITRLKSLRNEQSSYLSPDEYKIRKGYISKKIKYDDAVKLLKEVLSALTITPAFDPIYSIAGSLRRKKEMIGDIDILVYQEYYNQIINILSDEYELLSSGPEKSSFKLNNTENTQLDVVMVTHRDAPFKLLYLTGSKDFNIMQRGIAKKRGYTLNQLGIFGIKDNKSVLEARTEEDIFEFLNMNYVEPQNR